MAGCCPNTAAPACHSAKRRIDWLLTVSAVLVLCGYVLGWLLPQDTSLHAPHHFAMGVQEFVHRMWFGLLLAFVFVALLSRVPQSIVLQTLGKGGTATGLVRATAAGVLLDLCSHGILMVASKLYKQGASLGQVMAFLIASPWNSLSLTVILFTLIGWQYTLLFIVLSMVIALISGALFDTLVKRGVLPVNPNTPQHPDAPVAVWPTLKKQIQNTHFTPRFFIQLLTDGLRECRIVLRWLLFGIVLAALIRAFVPVEIFADWFAPTLLGLAFTTLAATIIEVCSEGSVPIGADLLNRAGAPGNAFTFLMAGVSTDYTEIMILKDTTKSWKIALFLPLITMPQILLLGWLLNGAAF